MSFFAVGPPVALAPNFALPYVCFGRFRSFPHTTSLVSHPAGAATAGPASSLDLFRLLEPDLAEMFEGTDESSDEASDSTELSGSA